MFFVGSGSLVSQAVAHALSLGLDVDGVFCPVGDSSIARLRRDAVTFVETDDPNRDLPAALRAHDRPDVFSINNGFMLNDALLSSDANFFNIHNGLVQRYRGIAEICIFAALCAGEDEYGVTLHRLLPGQKVDSGPVIAQLRFPIETGDGFDRVMTKSLKTCQGIFERNVRSIVEDKFDGSPVDVAARSFSYRDVASVVATADDARLSRACRLGAYKAFFPRLSAAIETFAPRQDVSEAGKSGVSAETATPPAIEDERR